MALTARGRRQARAHRGHGHGGMHHGRSGGNMPGDPGTQGDARPPESAGKFPFIWGAQEQRVPVATIPFVIGTKAATVRVPKNGFLSKLLFRMAATINVTAGSAGTPNILNAIGSYVLSYNGGFQYRNLDGESMYVMDLARHAGPDFVQQSADWKNYNPASAGATTFNWIMEDEINLNTQANADKYLLAAHARNADITLDITFGAASTIYANTETGVFGGSLFVEGLYLLDPPSYAKFEEPDLNKVQQILTDTSYTNVTVGDNTVSIVPLNGPKYLQLFFKGQFNGIGDSQGVNTSITRVQLKLNNGLNRYDMSSNALNRENQRQFIRTTVQAAGTVQASLPPGWYCLDFLNDASVNGTVSMVGRNVISTQKLALLWLIVTVAAGTTLTANNMIKLIKRVELPAVGGTNRLGNPAA